jgi:adenosylhomocysteine nucleosidase
LRRIVLGLSTGSRSYPTGRDDLVRSRLNHDFGTFLMRVFSSAGTPAREGARSRHDAARDSGRTMMTRLVFGVVVAAGALAGAGCPTHAQTKLDPTPRTAVISAFQPEWVNLAAELRDRHDQIVNGIDFATGTIEGRPVLLFLSGISMVNASLSTQMALDRFAITRIVFSGIAGGADPELAIGDVVVPAQWREYLENAYARQTSDGYALPAFLAKPDVPWFGMMFPQPVEIAQAPREPAWHTWFPVDPDLLALARKTAPMAQLDSCTADHHCLSHPPRIVVGGNGVSGQSFIDNAAFRAYAHEAFGAEALDMESAAVAHVATVNHVPFIVFRSLSDLAGGGPGENEMAAFLDLAAANSASVVRTFLSELP